MDYKKIIAATAVTSAAFVVPAVVDAAGVEAVSVSSLKLGETVIAPDEYTFTNSSVSEKVTKYEWYIFYDGQSGILIGNTKSVQVPLNPNFTNAMLKMVIKTDSNNNYEKQITIDKSNYSSGTNFFETFAINGENKIEFLDGTATTGKVGMVNQPIQVIVPAAVKIMKYDWYIVDGTSSRLLGDEQDQIIEIPIAAAGKTLRVVMMDSNDNKYIRELNVNPLVLDPFEMDLKLNDKVINDADSSTTATSIAPGDMLSVENLVIKGHGEKIDILPSQAIVTYQWFYKKEGASTDPDTFSIIPGATGPMYLVPNDAFGRNLENISVAITVEVPDSGVDNKTQYTYVIKLDNKAATDLKTTIDDRLADPLKAYTVPPTSSDPDLHIDKFLEELEGLKGTYDNLSTGSKALVPNIGKVTQAIQDVKAVQALIIELKAFETELGKFEANASDVTHAKLVKQFDTIEKKYLKFDSLKRSVLEMNPTFKDKYIELMSQHLKNIKGFADDPTSIDKAAITANKVVALNKRIKDLYMDSDNLAYNISKFEGTDANANDLNPRTEMQKEILKIEAEIKNLDRKQQVAVYSNMLKTAKSDIKKAQSMADKIAALDKNAENVGEKEIKAILSAREAYKKLTFMQQSLITEDELAMFDEDAYSEETVIEDLSEAIKQLVNGTSYVFESYTTPLLNVDATFANAIDVLLANYKALNSKAKKSVTNYAVLTQAKKDLTTATKVIKSITNAYDFHSAMPAEDVEKKMKSIQSKYRAAYNAYVKLTPLQRSIVEEISEISLDDLADELEVVTDEAFNPNDPDVEYDTTSIENVVIELTALEAAVTTGNNQSTASLETKIKEIEAAYKALKGTEKKGVYNYSILSRAKSLVKKAVSVEASLVSALNSGSTSRMNSAVKSYDKLTTGQKKMIEAAYEDVMDALKNPAKEELLDALAELDLEFLDLNQLKDIEEFLAKIDKKEHKNIPGYSKYQEALKIQKAVDSFLKKFNKLDPEPTYSKKQSILKDFKKLTIQQLNYLKASYTDPVDIYELLVGWETELNNTAITLNDEIGKLIVVDGASYKYSVDENAEILTNLETAIAKIKSDYKALDAKERKLVTHYSFISKIERDIKAVRKAVELKAAPSFQQTYNRLTNQQQDLYDLVVPPTTP